MTDPVTGVPLIPVLDVLSGITVQAVAGQRDSYRPLRSRLTNSTDPSVVLGRLESVCQSGTAYVADLDGIVRARPNCEVLARLMEHGVRLLVDAGIRCIDDVRRLGDLGLRHLIAGLETLPDPTTAADLIQNADGIDLILSIDLKHGHPQSPWPPWARAHPLSVVQELADIGFDRWIVLDLAAVGTNSGPVTPDLCREIRRLRPDDELFSGGGVRSLSDVQAFGKTVDGVLVSPTRHPGSIRSEELHTV